MFFVLSSGRSGSQSCAEAFNDYSNCCCKHHPQPELVLEAAEYYLGRRDEEEIAGILRETRPMTSDQVVYGEVNLQLSLIAPVLNNVFPDCRFIWLLRDGRDVVASMFHRGWYDPEIDPVRRPLWHQARLRGDETGDFTTADWEELSRFGRCCWLWRKYNDIIEAFLATIDRTRWKQVRLDRLKAALPELSQFLGLKGAGRVKKLNTAKQPVVYWHDWNAADRQLFNDLCGGAMDQWFPEWRSARGEWQEIAYCSPDRSSIREWFSAEVRSVVAYCRGSLSPRRLQRTVRRSWKSLNEQK